jgi:hypothetical protein
MARFYIMVGLITLSVYSWAQYRGVGLFDDIADSTPLRGPAGRSTFHK